MSKVNESLISTNVFIGTNDADNEVSTTLVAANADGSVLEREEFIQVAIAAIKPIAGTLTDTADHTASTATIMKLLRWFDQNIGAFDGGADPQGSIYRALGTDATNSIKTLIDNAKTVVDAVKATGVISLENSTGKGTALAANKTIVDALGSDGTTSLKATIDLQSTATVVGGLTDTSKKTADVSTVMNLLRSNSDDIGGVKTVVDAAKVSIDTALVNSVGKGTSLATNKTIIDALGSDGTTSLKATIDLQATKAVVGILTDVADETASTATVMNQLRAVLSRGIPRIIKKTVTFDGTSGKGTIGAVPLFTVTGLVKMRVFGKCTTNLTSDTSAGGATISLGITGTVEKFIAATIAEDIDATDIWHDVTTPDSPIELDTVAPFWLNLAKNVIATVAVDEVVSGVIDFICEYVPMDSGASVV